MLTGPIPATREVLERSGLRLDEIDLFEVNEAFASVPLAWQSELDADPEPSTSTGAPSPSATPSAPPAPGS